MSHRYSPYHSRNPSSQSSVNRNDADRMWQSGDAPDTGKYTARQNLSKHSTAVSQFSTHTGPAEYEEDSSLTRPDMSNSSRQSSAILPGDECEFSMLASAYLQQRNDSKYGYISSHSRETAPQPSKYSDDAMYILKAREMALKTQQMLSKFEAQKHPANKPDLLQFDSHSNVHNQSDDFSSTTGSRKEPSAEYELEKISFISNDAFSHQPNVESRQSSYKYAESQSNLDESRPYDGYSDHLGVPLQSSARSHDPLEQFTNCDPTIENILKSIGFNFQMSDMKQAEAQEREKSTEDPSITKMRWKQTAVRENETMPVAENGGVSNMRQVSDSSSRVGCDAYTYTHQAGLRSADAFLNEAEMLVNSGTIPATEPSQKKFYEDFSDSDNEFQQCSSKQSKKLHIETKNRERDSSHSSNRDSSNESRLRDKDINQRRSPIANQRISAFEEKKVSKRLHNSNNSRPTVYNSADNTSKTSNRDSMGIRPMSDQVRKSSSSQNPVSSRGDSHEHRDRLDASFESRSSNKTSETEEKLRNRQLSATSERVKLSENSRRPNDKQDMDVRKVVLRVAEEISRGNMKSKTKEIESNRGGKKLEREALQKDHQVDKRQNKLGQNDDDNDLIIIVEDDNQEKSDIKLRKSLEKDLDILEKRRKELIKRAQRSSRDSHSPEKDQIALLQNSRRLSAVKMELENLMKKRKFCEHPTKALAEHHETNQKNDSPGTDKATDIPECHNLKKARIEPQSEQAVIVVDSPADQVVKLKKMTVNYTYEDRGDHWCRPCNVLSNTLAAHLLHLYSDAHSPHIKKPTWASGKDKQASKPNAVATPIKGVEFLVPSRGFYCMLCEEFSANETVADLHVKTDAHNDKYQRFTDVNPMYEKYYNMEKEVRVCKKSEEMGNHEEPKKSNGNESKQRSKLDEIHLPPEPPIPKVAPPKASQPPKTSAADVSHLSNIKIPPLKQSEATKPAAVLKQSEPTKTKDQSVAEKAAAITHEFSGSLQQVQPMPSTVISLEIARPPLQAAAGNQATAPIKKSLPFIGKLPRLQRASNKCHTSTNVLATAGSVGETSALSENKIEVKWKPSKLLDILVAQAAAEGVAATSTPPSVLNETRQFVAMDENTSVVTQKTMTSERATFVEGLGSFLTIGDSADGKHKAVPLLDDSGNQLILPDVSQPPPTMLTLNPYGYCPVGQMIYDGSTMSAVPSSELKRSGSKAKKKRSKWDVQAVSAVEESAETIEDIDLPVLHGPDNFVPEHLSTPKLPLTITGPWLQMADKAKATLDSDPLVTNSSSWLEDWSKLKADADLMNTSEENVMISTCEYRPLVSASGSQLFQGSEADMDIDADDARPTTCDNVLAAIEEKLADTKDFCNDQIQSKSKTAAVSRESVCNVTIDSPTKTTIGDEILVISTDVGKVCTNVETSAFTTADRTNDSMIKNPDTEVGLKANAFANSVNASLLVADATCESNNGSATVNIKTPQKFVEPETINFQSRMQDADKVIQNSKLSAEVQPYLTTIDGSLEQNLNVIVRQCAFAVDTRNKIVDTNTVINVSSDSVVDEEANVADSCDIRVTTSGYEMAKKEVEHDVGYSLASIETGPQRLQEQQHCQSLPGELVAKQETVWKEDRILQQGTISEQTPVLSQEQFLEREPVGDDQSLMYHAIESDSIREELYQAQEIQETQPELASVVSDSVPVDSSQGGVDKDLPRAACMLENDADVTKVSIAESCVYETAVQQSENDSYVNVDDEK